MKDKPIDLGMGEYWYKGCFIQKQSHSNILPFHIFKDTENQETVGTCYTMTEAKRIAKLNEVKNYKYGAEAFL